MPYWDWTSTTGLPQLAVQYNEWRSGPIKGQNGLQTTRGFNAANNFNEAFRIDMQQRVTIALCTRNLENFDVQIEDPHNWVHGVIGGAMGATTLAAYDPIFYLHHTYIDYLYAYWQELQDIRQLPRIDSGGTSQLRMPPFSGITDNNTNLGASIPNPWELTRIFSTANDVDDYQRNFGYRFDRLVFNGYSPTNFVRNEAFLCNNRQIVRVAIANGEVSSNNKIFVRGIDEVFGTFSVFGQFSTDLESKRSGGSIRSTFFEPYSRDIDVTDIYKKYKISPSNITLDLYVKSYDLDGKPLDFIAYKPMAGYIDGNNQRTYAVLQDSLDQYLPVMKFCDVHTKLKVYGINGNENGNIEVTTTVQISDNTRSLIVGPDTGCLLKVC